jgi:hypothetical protein
MSANATARGVASRVGIDFTRSGVGRQWLLDATLKQVRLFSANTAANTAAGREHVWLPKTETRHAPPHAAM